MGGPAGLLACLVLAVTPVPGGAARAADFETGETLVKQRRFDEAFHELLPAAVAGHATAQLYVANMYRLGYGVKRDYGEAAR